MRFLKEGRVNHVEIDQYTRPDGSKADPKVKVYLSSDPRFVDTVEGPVDVLGPVEVGDQVAIVCNVAAKVSKAGNAYLNVWGVELADRVPAVDGNASNGKAKATATA